MKVVNLWLLAFMLCCIVPGARAAETSSGSAPTFIKLSGYLGKEEIAQAEQKLQGLAGKAERSIVIELNSSSGEINRVLEFVKALYISKLEHRDTITLYIDDKAVGPAALLPFVADALYVSPVASWGEISLGNEGTIPPNILRNLVQGVLSAENPNFDLLQLLAAAMSDKAAQSDAAKKLGKVKGEALVLNQQQLETLKLAKVLSVDNFRKEMHLTFPLTPIKPSLTSSTKGSHAAHFYKDTLTLLERHIHFNPNGPNEIGHLIIEDHSSSITQATWLYIKNGLDYYKKTKPLFVILELNTPGGEVFAAQKISDALKEFDTQYDIPIVCYINNWAISAGAMLAYSCRFIAVTKDGTMGAAEPVVMGEGNEMKPASEKINSALRADFASRARYFDRNPYIAEAMVDKDLILVVRHGEVVPLDSESQIKSSGPDPDILLTPKGKLLTLSAEQMLTYGVADILLFPQKTGLISEKERESGRWPADRMLLFHAPFFDGIPEATIDSYQMDWKSRFFALLASPMVSSLLLLGLILGFYVELSTPGFGLPGAIGVICLILIVLSSFALEIAKWLELILLIVGLAVMVIDLFLLPTFGLLGFAGLLFFLIGLFGLLLPGLDSIEYEADSNTFNAAGQYVLERIAWFSSTLLLSGSIIFLLARYITPSLASYSSLVLEGNEQDAAKGYIAGDNPILLPQKGTSGEVASSLRPAGKVLIGGAFFDALSDGNFIEKGEKITVLRLEGSVIVVGKKKAASSSINENKSHEERA